MGLFGKKSKNEKVEVQAVQNTAKSVDIKAEEEGKLTEISMKYFGADITAE